MTYITIIAVILLGSLVIYALTGGADYGGGMWDLLARGPRAEQQRKLIEHAIKPIWEANHVWLILIITVLFTAFPAGFGAIMTALHIPMTLILIGVVLRGSSFIFRSYGSTDERAQRVWSRVFGAASFLTPFLLGLCVGALSSGDIQATTSGEVTSGFFAGWTSPFAISCGLFAQGLFALLAATYLTVDAADVSEVQDDFRLRAMISELLLAPAAALVFVLAMEGAPMLFERLTDWWTPWLLAATSLSAITALFALWQRRFKLARNAVAAQVGLILLGWGLAQYPYLILPGITLGDVVAPEATLRALVIALAVGAVFLFPSFGYLFFVFKRQEGRAKR